MSLPPGLKEELQKDYINSFESKIRELWHAFKEQDQKTLLELFHKLAGSGKTYEMDEISLFARQCESILKTGFKEEKVKKSIEIMQRIFETRKHGLKPSEEFVKKLASGF